MKWTTNKAMAGTCLVSYFVSLHVYKCPPLELLTIGVMLGDVTPCDWLKNFYTCNVAAIVGIVSRCDLNIDALIYVVENNLIRVN